jgi:hypothetical protein
LVFDDGQTHLAGDNSQLVTATKTVVALTGRVPVKVSMENGSIRVGDPLTSSSKPSTAMKATEAGKILGYALESADKNGTVLLFVQPGYWAAPVVASLKATVQKLHRENVQLRNQFQDLLRQVRTIRTQLDEQYVVAHSSKPGGGASVPHLRPGSFPSAK